MNSSYCSFCFFHHIEEVTHPFYDKIAKKMIHPKIIYSTLSVVIAVTLLTSFASITSLVLGFEYW